MPERPPHLPDFEQPPVIEVALAVQFEPVIALRQGHLGLFWSKIKTEFPHTRDLPPLAGSVERLDDEETPSFEIEISDLPPLHRAWFVSEKEERLIQIQSDRFAHNWRLRPGEEEYPHFEPLFDTFCTRLSDLEAIVEDAGGEALAYRQVEVTYLNWIPATEIGEVLRGASTFSIDVPGVGPQPTGERIALRFPVEHQASAAGHLYLETHRAHNVGGTEPTSGYFLSLTFKGPMRGHSDRDRLHGLMERGREVIVESFAAVTEPSWHKIWRKKA